MGATKTMITKDIAFVGMRVCRGRDWIYGNQDGGIGKPGTIKDIAAIVDNNIKVQWDHSSLTYYYRSGNDSKYDLYLWEDEVPTKKDPGNPREVFAIGDKLKCVRYARGSDTLGLSVGNIYTVKSFHEGGIWNYVFVNENTHSHSVECFEKISTPAPTWPDTFGYYEKAIKGSSGEKFEKGDVVIFVKHIHDSANNSALKLESGKEYVIEKLNTCGPGDDYYYGNDYVYLKEGGCWVYSSQCFKKVRSASGKDAYGRYPNAENIEGPIFGPGDIVEFVKHVFDSELNTGLSVFVYGQYKVTKFEKSTNSSRGRYQLRLEGCDNWVYSNQCFKLVKSAYATSPKFTPLKYGDVESGDEVTLGEHSIDSKGVLEIGKWYRVNVANSGSVHVFLKGDSGSGWGVQYRHLDQVRKKTPIVEEKKVVVDTRAKMADVITDNKKFAAGDWVECIKAEDYEIKCRVKVGDRFKVTGISGSCQYPKGVQGIVGGGHHIYWMNANNFKLVKSAIISSSIKTKEHVTDKRVSRTGGAIKVRSPLTKIREGKRLRKSPVCIGAGGARSGKSHS